MMLCNTNPTARWGLLTATLSLLMAGALYAQPQPQVKLVADTNTSDDSGAGGGGMAVVGNELYFVADDGVHGAELWKTDGTTPTLVKDINPNGGSSIDWLTEFDGKLFFAANDGINGVELWVSDGTEAGTDMLINLNQGSGSNPSELYVFNNKLYFAADGGNGTGRELWETDGTNTVPVDNINPGASDSNPGSMTEYNGELYFAATRSGGFNPVGRELFKLDTNGSVTLAFDIVSGSDSSSPAALCVYAGKLYFNATTTATGTELWEYDGQTAPTLFHEFATGNAGGNPDWLTVFSGKLYFAASKGLTDRELWSWDGTAAVPSQFTNINPGSASSSPTFLCEYNNALYFNADNGADGFELWRTDGNSAPVMVHDLDPSSDGDPQGLTVFDGKLYFCGYTPLTGFELWKTDGTNLELAHDLNQVASGCRDDLSPPPNHRPWSDAVVLGGSLYFVALDGVHQAELWRHDSLTGVTDMVKDISSGVDREGSYIKGLTVLGDKLYFLAAEDASSATGGWELWRHDPSGLTEEVLNINPNGNAYEFTGFLNVADGSLYFVADDGDHGLEMWRHNPLDGTTAMIVDANNGVESGVSTSPSYQHVVAFDGLIFFVADDGSLGRELWKYDPSSGSASIVYDVWSGSNDGDPKCMTVVNGSLYFFAFDGTDYSLWRHTQSGATEVVSTIWSYGVGGNRPNDVLSSFVVGDTLYFVADTDAYGQELWRYDSASSSPAELVKDVDGNPSDSLEESALDRAAVLNGKLYFEADDGVNGRELWCHDPGMDSTYRVTDVFTTGSSLADSTIAAFSGALYFEAQDGTRGYELWRYVPSANQTEMLADINPDGGSSDPANLVVVNDSLYFMAYSPVHGFELWSVSFPSNGGGNGGGGDDDESCSTTEGSGTSVLILLGMLSVLILGFRQFKPASRTAA